MHLRLVRVMRRQGSDNRYFVQRIPADVRGRAVGMTLTVPVGGTPVPLRINESTASIRVSLRTGDHSEAKVRQAVIAAHVARVWESLRTEVRRLTQKEAVALAGESTGASRAPWKMNRARPRCGATSKKSTAMH